jgi:hypothetical protein
VAAAKGDAIVERGAQRLQALSEGAARRGGVAGKLAHPLAEDAAFLRKLKPSLVKARMHGDAPTNEKPEPVVGPTPAKRTHSGARGGPSPVAVIAGAAAAGLATAKVIDWRGHAHPRR